MPPWLTDVLKLVGFASPFAYGFAVYSFCMHLDRRGISAKGRAAIANWLQPKQYEPVVVGDAVLEIFDKIYSKPLLSLRALARSALITIGVSAICLYETWPAQANIGMLTEMPSIVITSALTNIFLDYISLFLVRHFLIVGRSKPIVSALVAPMAGVLLVLLIYTFRNVLWYTFIEDISMNPMSIFLHYSIRFLSTVPDGTFLGALAVHLWLPLLAVAVGVLKLLNYFRAAVGMTQSFLTKGGSHPLEAIGYVAGTIVFAITAMGRPLLW